VESDGDIVRRVRDGDVDAYGELVLRHQQVALAIAWSLAGDAAEAEDLAQESFIRALRNIDMLADPERFLPWLRRITFGTCIDWLRSFRPQLYASSDNQVGLDDQLAADADGPLEEFERVQLRQRVLAAVGQLPPRYRTPLTLFHLDGLSHERVAERLGIAVGSARSLVSRARQRLAPLLAAYAPEDRDVDQVDDVFADRSSAPRLLHITNGDSAGGSLIESGVPGTVAVWADVLHEGRVRPDSGTDEWRRDRARFIAGTGWASETEALEIARRWDAAIERFRDYDEVVLWFEHDLFDQLLIIRHLEWFGRQSRGNTQLALICIGEFPGIVPFHGLGQLTPDQLASLADTRQRVTTRQIELATTAWRAFTSDDPRNIVRVIDADTPALPFLDGALRRLLEQFPDVRTGLARTERQILEILAAGPHDIGQLFVECAAREERVFMGDATFLLYLQRLAGGVAPAITIDGEARPHRALPHGTASITDAGRRALDGKLDFASVNPIDRWIGGVHVHAPGHIWRWHEAERRMVAPH
jgi:RNA polymerase sigma factor (sigma-70 family)